MVIDTSALLAVLLDEPERGPLIAATTGIVLFAPASVPWEIGNALVAMVRRRRLSPAEARRACAAYETIPLRVMEVDVGEAVGVAIELGLYACDAYMLVLARNRRLPLLTLDKQLGTASRKAGVALVEI